MPIRVALCISTLDTGGAERKLTSLATRLAPSDFETALFVLAPPPAPPRDALLRVAREHQVPVMFLGAKHLWDAPRTLHRLTAALREFRPDLMQSFLFHANTLGAIAARRARVARVVAGIRVAERRVNLHCWLSRRLDPLVDKYVAVSDSVARFAENEMGLSAEKLLVIPNGVDLAPFLAAQPVDRSTLGLPTGRRMLLVVGRLDRQKRLDWLLRRMPEILAQLPQHDLVLAGNGPQRDPLGRLARRLSVEGRVHFLGWRDDVPQLLAASDLVLLTSAWEGMPNSVLEAMAAGKPVVATAVEGLAQLLGSAATEQMVPGDAADEFVRRVVAVATDSRAAERLGVLNRERVTDQYSLDAMVAQYAQLYKSLVFPS